jgi:hypothetical protein
MTFRHNYALRILAALHHSEKYHLPFGVLLGVFGLINHKFHLLNEVFERLVWMLFCAYWLFQLYIFVRVRFGSPFDSRTRLRDFRQLPDGPGQVGTGSNLVPIYRFLAVGAATGQDERLQHFVRLSESSTEIAGAHPELDSNKRLELYRNWWLWNRDSFMLLEEDRGGGATEVICGTIILPLTPAAHKALKAGEITVLNLQQNHVWRADAKSKPHQLLLDTWVLPKRYRAKHGHWADALVLRHLSMFWNPDEQKTMTLLVEPDNPKITRAVGRLGFVGSWTTSSGSELYELRYPRDVVGSQRRDLLAKVLGNLRVCRTWPVA